MCLLSETTAKKRMLIPIVREKMIVQVVLKVKCVSFGALDVSVVHSGGV
jgi:hypothetical protein